MKLTFVFKGGEGSGNHGHEGRPGMVGGSASGNVGVSAPKGWEHVAGGIYSHPKGGWVGPIDGGKYRATFLDQNTGESEETVTDTADEAYDIINKKHTSVVPQGWERASKNPTHHKKFSKEGWHSAEVRRTDDGKYRLTLTTYDRNDQPHNMEHKVYDDEALAYRNGNMYINGKRVNPTTFFASH